MTKKQFMAKSAAQRGQIAAGAQRKARARRPRAQAQNPAPRRNGAGRRRGQRRQRGGTGAGQGFGFSNEFTPGVKGLMGGTGAKPCPHDIDEQVSAVNGSIAFTVTEIDLNPGNPNFLPFLSVIAQRFERYEFMWLELIYNPSQNVNSTQGAGGFVGISASDDAKQASPSSQAIAEIFTHSGPTHTALPQVLRLSKKYLESAAKQKHYVRPNGLIPGGTDPHEYDCGKYFFWTVGQAGAGAIGELRIRGKVIFYNPVLESSTNPPLNYNVSNFSSAGVAMPATTVPANLALATVIVNSNSVVNTAGSFVPPVGNYLVGCEVTATAGTAFTQLEVQLMKNGVPGGTAANIIIAAGAVLSSASVNTTFNYITCNGTDAITFVITPTYTGAAGTYAAQATFLAV